MVNNAVPEGDPTTPHEAALRYVALGWRVLPIKEGGKIPILNAWQQHATSDPAQVDEWWSGLYRKAGVGLLMGHNGLFAIDVDVAHGHDGMETLKDLEYSYSPLPDTVCAQTPSGGAHFIFRAPPGVTIRNDAGRRLGPGIDIRGEGGQIVAMPTTREDGRAYVWVWGCAPWERPVADAPGWLIDLLTKDDLWNTDSASTKTTPASSGPTAPAGVGPMALSTIPPTSSTPGLSTPRPGDRFNQATTWEALLANDGWTRTRNGPQGEQRWTRPGKHPKDGISATVGWAGTDLLKVFTSSIPGLNADATYSRFGYWTATRHHGDHAAAARTLAALEPRSSIDDLIGTFTEAPETPADGPGLARWRIDWPTFWTNDHTDTEWLLEPLLAKGRGHALYAAAKSGKSLLLLEAAAALATNRHCLSQAPSEPHDVLYVDYEMSEADLLERLDTMGYGPDDNLTRLHYILLPSIPGLDTAEGARYIVEAAITWHCQLVVIDTTARAVEGEENSADTFRAFYRHLGLALKSAGITYIRADHAGKDAEKGQRGSSAKNDDVDVVWWYSRMEGGGRLEAKYRRMAWVPDKVELRIIEEPHLTHRLVAEPSYLAGTKELAASMDELNIPLHWGRGRVRRALLEGGVEYTKRVLEEALKYRKRARAGARAWSINDYCEQLPGQRGQFDKTAGQTGWAGERAGAGSSPSVSAGSPAPLKGAGSPTPAPTDDPWDPFGDNP